MGDVAPSGSLPSMRDLTREFRTKTPKKMTKGAADKIPADVP